MFGAGIRPFAERAIEARQRSLERCGGMVKMSMPSRGKHEPAGAKPQDSQA
jgi:hypothetical protein